jgi:hypothetical protein
VAVHFLTDKPAELLSKFEVRIAQKEPKGKIDTWVKVVANDNTYFTHIAKDWAKLAFFKPLVGKDRLTFNLLRPEKKTVDEVVYGYYHGHLTQTFLAHFRESFTQALSSAQPEKADNVAEKTSQ